MSIFFLLLKKNLWEDWPATLTGLFPWRRRSAGVAKSRRDDDILVIRNKKGGKIGRKILKNKLPFAKMHVVISLLFVCVTLPTVTCGYFGL